MQGTGPARVFVDANVWFSRTLRDWIGVLYVTPDDPPFVVHWSEDVLAEVLYHLRKKHPHWHGERITGIRDQLARTFEAGRVAAFEIDPTYRGRDAGDAHVHAATLACGADVLVTCNVADFNGGDNGAPYEVMLPDEFLVLVDDATPHLVRAAAERMESYWRSRGRQDDLPSMLRRAGCPQFATRLERHLSRPV